MNIWLLRWRTFYALKRARYCLFFFVFITIISLLAPIIANEKPLIIHKDSTWYFPIFKDYPERVFGGDFDTYPDYKDPFVRNLFKDSFVIYPLINYAPDSIDWELDGIPPSPPDSRHFLGTDDQGRDVASRLLYGLRTSLLFGIILSVCTILLGIIIGGLQGYYGGAIDLFGQRISEIWGAVPTLFLIIIISSVVVPTFWIILSIILFFSWTSIANVVRTEFLRTRNYDYIKAAKSLGFGNLYIAFVHILPNALIATVTYLPFLIIGSITTLATLDFLGFGMSLGSASLGELLNQGKNNLQSLHLGITGFVSMALVLSSLVFIGEGIRECFGRKQSL
ncbi:ABC transporter permease [Helicobacter aurati]|uniref:ABC transporter permease n=1 Tax=Helicobacter aurati TaxID=137778 RepID=A0A3D8J2H5_9HELI|nr:ABC transporter permease [Helicobacter aurati]RDU71345.1 ABC transporter permease [Helicobacter aurati]